MAIGYQLIRLVSDQGVIRLSLISLTFWTLRLCGTNLREPKVSSTFKVPGSDWWDMVGPWCDVGPSIQVLSWTYAG